MVAACTVPSSTTRQLLHCPGRLMVRNHSSKTKIIRNVLQENYLQLELSIPYDCATKQE